MPLTVATGYCTRSGRRDSNEDFVGMVTPVAGELATKGVLAALADGMSGNGGGREAAEYTVRSLLNDYYATPDTWPVPLALDRVLQAANRWLLSHSTARPEHAGAATTLTSIALRGRRYYFAHIGDSRAYLLRGKTLTCLTVDHVWDRPDMRHVLTRAIGMDAHPVIDYGDDALETGDIFLLVCDGIWEKLGRPTLVDVLRNAPDPEAAARTLCDEAHERGSLDNLSAIVLRVDALPPEDFADAYALTQGLAVPPKIAVGQTLDGYAVRALLHESRGSLVYQVEDETNGVVLVLKTLPPQQADDPDAAARFAHEEWLARRVVARFFPQYVAIPEGRRSHLYYLTTWHAGATLQQRLDAGLHLTVPQGIDWTEQLLRAIGALHRRVIIHRDIKPANVHVGDDGQLRVLDLGVALSGFEPPQRSPHAGTPSYIAPEQFAGAAPSPQADLYAAGVVLYHTLTRRYPYGEIEPFQRPVFGDPIPPTRYRPDIPVWLENVILKAVAADPKKRFETAEEFLLALERGARRPLSAPSPTPLAERDPLTLWRFVAVLAIAGNLGWLYLLLRH